MTVYNAAQIAGFAKGAGITDPNTLVIATAIALEESGGDASVRNRQGSTAMGLWQIMVSAHRGEIAKRWPGQDPMTAMQDPIKNAAMMFHVSGGGKNWRPWAVYNSGVYKRSVNKASTAVLTGNIGIPSAEFANSGIGDSTPGSSATADTSGAQGFVDKITDPGTWIVAGCLIAGAIILMVGLARMSGATDVATSAAGTALDVAGKIPLPATKATKLLKVVS